MCTCSVHCVESPHHDKSCCSQAECPCECHNINTLDDVRQVLESLGYVTANAADIFPGGEDECAEWLAGLYVKAIDNIYADNGQVLDLALI